jgi:hypothetical protein
MGRNEEGFLFITWATDVEVVVSRVDLRQYEYAAVIRRAHPSIVEFD